MAVCAFTDFPLDGAAKELMQDNHNGTATQPVVLAVQFEDFEEEIADRFDKRFEFAGFKGTELGFGFGGRG